ncbi:class I SAM-dependent methyltransferase [Nitratiruptor sp. SB155-2]|uniref:class I SAM-dependent methyltransferase n=1 Tax=Nitratiruptor sp. (strain SB155-2) TaxID=387092 RepID=UPI00015871C1|nr:class I SAM-dependent methyltransferase [Nitratiruptor sp. SB155-2]BAF70944.1 methyl transferase [Nitratiruptor sp. SB155-2]
MHHIKEFNRFASDYQQYKIIQSKVAKHLVKNSKYQGKKIADLGAGSGEVYRSIFWEFEKLYACDLSSNMLALHPEEKVEKIICDFDTKACFERIKRLDIDQIFASSSLQWSKDLPTLFYRLSQLQIPLSLALFTSNTFKTIHSMLGIESPIYTEDEILQQARNFFMLNYEKRVYRLFFSSSKEMFTYIKRSGVSAGKKMASIGELKRLFREYPHSYLEFEVVFLWVD